MVPEKPTRLASLDVLRGFDMFVLVILNPFLLALSKAIPDCFFTQFIIKHSTHATWEGFTFHDLIMPLFLFVSGVAIPFAFAKFRKGSGKFSFDKRSIFKRMGRRMILLWLLGMVVQGNLLALDPQRIYFYSNTLQSIAVGYLFASLFYIYFSWKSQIGIAFMLMASYILVMAFSAEGWGMTFGGGSYEFPGNMAEFIDRTVLGRFRDGVSWNAGEWRFSNWYGYTWILSSLTFIVTTMSGVAAGEILLLSRGRTKALKCLLLYGLVMLLLSCIMSFWIPIVKPIWTPSMVLLSSGLSVIMLSLFYWIVDILGYIQWSFPLRVIGANAIVAYLIGSLFDFSNIVNRLLYGFNRFLPDPWYAVLLTIGEGLLIYWILWIMYKGNRFLRV